MNEETKKAARDAILAHLDRMKAAHQRRVWAFNDCPHLYTTKTITAASTHEHCEVCGAVRSDYTPQPNMKEGETLEFRASDFRRKGE